VKRAGALLLASGDLWHRDKQKKTNVMDDDERYTD
jgi:hypothetical protein